MSTIKKSSPKEPRLGKACSTNLLSCKTAIQIQKGQEPLKKGKEPLKSCCYQFLHEHILHYLIVNKNSSVFVFIYLPYRFSSIQGNPFKLRPEKPINIKLWKI